MLRMNRSYLLHFVFQSAIILIFPAALTRASFDPNRYITMRVHHLDKRQIKSFALGVSKFAYIHLH